MSDAPDMFNPVVIIGRNSEDNPTEALHFDGTADAFTQIKYWVRNAGGRTMTEPPSKLIVETIQGPLTPHAGDWVVMVGVRKFAIIPDVLFQHLFAIVK